MKIEIGCGGTKNEGFIGIDRFALPGVDIVADINKGLPIEDNKVSLLFSSHSLEHFADLPTVMKEIYRVCKHGAQVCIVVPYHETLLNKANPYHLQVFNEHTFRFFSKEKTYYTDNEDFIFPHAKDYGLLYSDNSDLHVNFVLANIEYFYFEGFDVLSTEEQRYYRKHFNDVCDQVVYHLLVLKEELSESAILDMIKNTTLYYPNYVLERKEKLKGKIEACNDISLNNMKRSILSPITKDIIESQEIKQKELEETTQQHLSLIENQFNTYVESQEIKQKELEETTQQHLSLIKNQFNTYVESQEKKQKELEETTQQHLSLIKNQGRLLSLYVAKSSRIRKIWNNVKNNDNLIFNMNVNRFNERLVLSLNECMDDYRIKFSDFIKAYPSYSEYKLSSSRTINKLEFYCEIFSPISLTYEIVQNNQIIYNHQISIIEAGSVTILLPESSGEFQLRLQVANENEFLCVAEWYPKSLFKKILNETKFCCIADCK